MIFIKFADYLNNQYTLHNMKKLLTLFLLASLAASAAWAEDLTVTKTMNDIVTENGFIVSSGSDATCYTSFSLDDYITISTTGEANCGSFWGTTTKDWRLYQNKNGNIIVTAASNYQQSLLAEILLHLLWVIVLLLRMAK